ncbi:SusC/RagA family TonB-linked outer membrane protein [Aquimarina sp. ERC-38]|uniref:SusC/RagA family TonB-linked outer membrane protein n=1 Tax=Aquimarina sp. ERC-38 TaxID=2949996 RepID=UPI0022460B98|nr:SusC/RagA family TonB-linked outer membrane protein [Aquimarina sp. ERC-38]UZO81316.1 SusC/RagA family TonB-linked outer membrane protein [Aquimarina sp. ERC-38]
MRRNFFKKVKHAFILILFQLLAIQFSSASTTYATDMDQIYLDFTLEEASLQKVFEMIEQKTTFQFAYMESTIPLDRKISITAKQRSLQNILEEVSSKFGLYFKKIKNKIIIQPAQKKIMVTGQITDQESGDYLIGATVQIKGTNTGTTSDFDGKFNIEVMPDAILLISYLGYENKEVQVTSEAPLTIEMNMSANTIEDVVVTALNIKRAEKTIGYATQQIGGEALEEANETNLISTLSGKVAGVQITNTSGAVGSSSSIVLRGYNSISGNNQPLFVIDGMPISNEVHQTSRAFGGPANPNQSSFLGEGIDGGEQQVDYGNAAGEINPADIESIQILKGANAAALYGSRAANGVILITTKSGSSKKGIGVNLTSSLSFQTPLKTPKFQTQFGKGDNGLYAFPELNTNVGKNFGPRFNGQLIPQYDPNNPEIARNRPWVNRLGEDPVGDFLRTGITKINGFSITNGGEKGNFRLSYTRFDQEGMVPNTDLIRNTVGFNSSYRATEKFEVGASVNYISSRSDNRPNIGAKSESNIIFTLLQLGGNESLDELRNYWEPFGENTQQATSDRSVNNPYFLVNENLNGNRRDRVFGNVHFTYDFSDHLSLRVKTGRDMYSDKRTTIKAFSHVPYQNGFYSEANVFFKEDNSDFLFSYDNKFNEKFSITAIAGANHFDQKIEELRGNSGTDGLVTPGFFNLSNSISIPVARNFISRKRINSVYGGLTLGFNDYIFLDITGRNDWSSTLPTGNNSYFYPSASVSAILTDMVDLSGIGADYLKVRASYAEVGNDTDPYQTNPLTFNGGSSEGIAINTISSTLGNKDLVPENIVSTEFGLEAGFFNGRLGLDFTYYQIQNQQQIATIPLPTESGFLSQVINVPAEITNNGMELSLNLIPVKTPSFKWDLTLNWARNRNKITGLTILEEGERITLAERWINLDITNNGSFGDFYGDYLLRVDENGNLGRNGLQIYRPDGRSEESDDVGSLVDEPKPLLGNANPDWIGGIQNTLTYKNLNLSFLFDINKGGQVHSRTFVVGNQLGSLEKSVTLQQRDDPNAVQGAIQNGNTVVPGEQWVELQGATLDRDTGDTSPATIYARTSNFYKRYYDNDAVGTFDRSFVKLRELKLTYNVPESLLRSIKLQNLQIAIFGRNLLLWDNVPHIDPEVAGYSGELPGGEFFAIPSARSVGMSLNVNF